MPVPADEAVLHQAIAAAGDDPGPRLAFADWLEEQGDPRSDFVRAGCGVELPADVRDELPWRWIEHEAEWIRPVREAMGPSDPRIGEYRFADGLPSEIALDGVHVVRAGTGLFERWPLLSALDIPHGEGIAAALARAPFLPRVRRLSLTGSSLGPQQLSLLFGARGWQRLRHLDLSSSEIDEDSLSCLVEWPAVRELSSLHLRGNLLGYEAGPILGSAQFSRLRHLNLAGNHLWEDSVGPLASASWLSRLESLDLTHSKLGNRITELLTSARCENLREAVLRNVDLGEAPLDRFPSLSGWPLLQRLSIDANHLTARHLEPLVRCPWLSGLQHLSLSSNAIGDEGLAHLAAARLPQLRSLNLAETGIGAEALRRFAETARFPELRALNLGENLIVASALEALLSSELAENLKRLTLGGAWGYQSSFSVRALARGDALARLDSLVLSHIEQGSDSLAILAASHACRSLRELSFTASQLDSRAVEILARSHPTRLLVLDLHANQLDDSAVRALAASPQLQSLRRLNLSQNLIGEPGVKALVESPHLTGLTHLDLRHNPLGARAAEWLSGDDALPNLLSVAVTPADIGAGGLQRLRIRFGARVK